MALKAILQVEKAFEKSWQFLPEGGRALLAVSGGVDSMVLLEVAARWAKKNFQTQRLLVVHVNHSLRGAESDGDESLVLARAQSLKVAVKSIRLKWAEGEHISQDKCRRRREEIFESLFLSASDRVMLAHHLNDQAETIFLRLMRGTGAHGLKGILPISGRKLRPFLGLEKSLLLRAAEDWKIPWREDSSNQSLDYDRNWVRALFPQIEKRRPGFQGKLAALAEEARGWKFASRSFELFSLEKGISFSRPPIGTSAAVLREAFQLSRRHTENLSELLGKPSGKTEAEGIRFWWSAGILLAERGAHFSSPLARVHDRIWRSALGEWSLPEAFAPVNAGGKKEFQALRVPIFFRKSIPLATNSEGRLLALLPRRLNEVAPFRFSPSPLATWWLGGH